MLDAITKARIELGLQNVPCSNCVHRVADADYWNRVWEVGHRAHCQKYHTGMREAGSCIPNTWNHFEPMG